MLSFVIAYYYEQKIKSVYKIKILFKDFDTKYLL
jgi:hypothetical protein